MSLQIGFLRILDYFCFLFVQLFCRFINFILNSAVLFVDNFLISMFYIILPYLIDNYRSLVMLWLSAWMAYFCQLNHRFWITHRQKFICEFFSSGMFLFGHQSIDWSVTALHVFYLQLVFSLLRIWYNWCLFNIFYVNLPCETSFIFFSSWPFTMVSK